MKNVQFVKDYLSLIGGHGDVPMFSDKFGVVDRKRIENSNWQTIGISRADFT
jgi:hypothetical protein